jgi:N-ethylmaleimide reductase
METKNQLALLSPINMSGLKLANRVVMAPLTRSRAGEERMPNALMQEYYEQRASAGLIISEATTISLQANGWLHTPGIYTDAQTEAWKKIVDAVHKKGGHFFLQLWHTGRAGHSSFQAHGELPVAPSAIRSGYEPVHTPIGKQPLETPRALETDEIPGIVEDYRKAAQRAKDAGFDGVEIHGANGYLIDTFLQSKTNHRTDRYGGSLENRYRFLKEIVQAVSIVWTSERVGVKLDANTSYNDMGSPDFRETFLFVAAELAKENLAYLQVVPGVVFGFHNLGEPMHIDEFRQVYPGILMANGGYDKEKAEQVIESRDADLVAFGRPFISNPDLVLRFKNGWPLAEDASPKVWSSFEAEGYTTFPSHSES